MSRPLNKKEIGRAIRKMVRDTELELIERKYLRHLWKKIEDVPDEKLPIWFYLERRELDKRFKIDTSECAYEEFEKWVDMQQQADAIFQVLEIFGINDPDDLIETYPPKISDEKIRYMDDEELILKGELNREEFFAVRMILKTKGFLERCKFVNVKK